MFLQSNKSRVNYRRLKRRMIKAFFKSVDQSIRIKQTKRKI